MGGSGGVDRDAVQIGREMMEMGEVLCVSL